jgi:hypothetical protein
MTNPRRMLAAAAGRVVPATISFTDSLLDTNTLTTYTESGRAIGTAHSTRQVVACFSSQINSGNDPTVVSVTIGGVAATLVVASATLGSTPGNWMYKAAVPTGTTADVVIVFGQAQVRCFISLFAMYNADTTAHDTGTAANADPLTDTLNIPAGGVAVAGAQVIGNCTFTWTNLTEGNDTSSGTWAQSAASAAFATQQTALSITADPSAGSSGQRLVLASFDHA